MHIHDPQHDDVSPPAVPSPGAAAPSPSGPTRIVLIRHGETDWNVLGRLQGASDIPLNADGRAQAALTGRALAAQPAPPFEVLYSSPLMRAAVTADLIGRELGLEVAARVPELRERSFGLAEGMTWAERGEAFGPGLVEGQEADHEVRVRALAALERLAAAHPGGAVGAVTHGAVIRVIAEYLLQADPYSLPPVRNVSLTTLRHFGAGTWEVEELGRHASDEVQAPR
ncbi:histidine phosphatase family protein [Sediminivirga luteola]|uniref:Phosphoglycerate mutase n=1 Tax=Sediminivirga luteola TaxID=1774748 RepID=A0A8J2XJQ0_9MICO|nr:histidine phosphatase family protein [Sediminivirga luteola]MCI2266532.1 histidine phosphatase family protein [Sediminivirga luteola]GGA07710.1 phosphoglycerate mutase [Sediminivirga luteola]